MMEFSADQIYHGFRWANSRPIPEIAATAHLFSHLKTGARLLYLESDDINKVFGIGFRTPPTDSTGVAHIVEHCVLSGSRKYKTKEPFMDLIKSSLQTFLNAMTFPDKTIYPVASRNDKDFKNLTDVYLDAVFYPAIYEDSRIFAQEGWHYELETVEPGAAVGPADQTGSANSPASAGSADRADVAREKLSLSGVVYNEMKGVYSNPVSVLYNEVMAGLYPDTPYGFDSGGDPAEIPNLTEKAFLDFHRRYYHPSNSYIYFYGQLDLFERLAYLDREYLSAFDRRDIDSEIPLQAPPAKPVSRSADYAVPAGTDPAGKSYYAWAVCTPADLPVADRLRLEVLCDVLLDNSASPVREALLKEGLGEDVFGFNEHLRQGFCGVGLVNGPADAVAQFVEIVEGVLADQAAGALDRDSLLASINKMEYSLREAGGATNRGVAYFMTAFESWLYDREPAEALLFADYLEALRADVQAGRYEELIREFFLDQPHKLYLTLKPKPGLNELQEQALEAKLQAELKTFTGPEIADLKSRLAAFRAWQQEPESESALATIPRLEPGDINRAILTYEEELKQLAGCPELAVSYHAPGMLYLRLAFNLDHLAATELTQAALAVSLLNEMDTAGYGYKDLQTAINLKSGGISHALQTLRHEPTGTNHLYYMVNLRSTPDQWQGALTILQEILTQTDFADRRRAVEILGTVRVSLEQALTSSHTFAVIRAQAAFDGGSVIKDKVGGFAFYEDLCDWLQGPAIEQETCLAELATLVARMINPATLTVGLTAEAGPEREQAEAALAAFIEQLPAGAAAPAGLSVEPYGLQSEAFAAASQVQYVVQSFSGLEQEPVYRGQLTVASTLWSRGYLHNRVRAQGGAYGAGLTLGRNGAVTAYSYRDPQLERTLSVYAEAGRACLKEPVDRRQLEDTVIAAMNAFDTVLTPASAGPTALNLHLAGLTKADVLRNMEEAISTRPSDLTAFGHLLDWGFNGDAVATVVVGGTEKIREEAERFDHIYEVTEKGLKLLK